MGAPAKRPDRAVQPAVPQAGQAAEETAARRESTLFDAEAAAPEPKRLTAVELREAALAVALAAGDNSGQASTAQDAAAPADESAPWEPVEVPKPTYVEAAKAERPAPQPLDLPEAPKAAGKPSLKQGNAAAPASRLAERRAGPAAGQGAERAEQPRRRPAAPPRIDLSRPTAAAKHEPHLRCRGYRPGWPGSCAPGTAPGARRRSPQPEPASGGCCGQHDGATYFRGDVTTGEGLPEALAGADVVIDCLEGQTGKALRQFAAGGAILLGAALEAGVPKAVLLSIVNCDQSTYGYYRSKAEKERVYLRAELETVAVRATQFHSLLARIFAAGSRVGLVPVIRGARFQTIAPGDVAAALLEAALEPPSGESHRLRDDRWPRCHGHGGDGAHVEAGHGLTGAGGRAPAAWRDGTVPARGQQSGPRGALRQGDIRGLVGKPAGKFVA